MGGGGGGSFPSDRDFKTIGEIVGKSLREGAEAGKRNVFISFAHEDLREVNLLRGQAKNENSNLEFNDWSLEEPFDSARADYVRAGIRARIQQSSVTLIYLSERTADSQWVNWEVEESLRLGKGVLGVYKGSAPPVRLPTSIVTNRERIRLVPWTQSGLAQAIDEAAEQRS